MQERITWEGLFTKEQVARWLAANAIEDAPPASGKFLLVMFPGNKYVHRITKTKLKGADGRLLYRQERVEFVPD